MPHLLFSEAYDNEFRETDLRRNRLLSSMAICKPSIHKQRDKSERFAAFSQCLRKRRLSSAYRDEVLHEGLDIPQTNTAYLLASSSVRRGWVQRRGRISPLPGKTQAVLHDFLVLPPDVGAKEGKAVLRGELARAEEFAFFVIK